MAIRRWRLPAYDGELVKKLCRETGKPELVVRILCSRGVESPEEVEAFFSGAQELASPYSIKDMEPAVERIREALEYGERIAVYGDYDCDGITATTLMTSYLQSVGADVIYYVPSREKEGYGLNKGAVDILLQQKVELIITVDNGISAHEEIAYAGELGIDVVVTDHHTPRDTLPPVVVVGNPHRKDCGSAFKDLAGVGVAFKLICALEEAEGAELLEYYSDLVALGTVADVVPLVGENRAIVRHGLSRLCETENQGLKALLDVSGLSGKTLTGESVAFGVIPRINAAGRMGCTDDAIELLLTDDPGYAMETAELVNGKNEERKKIEEAMISEIEGILSANPQILTRRVLIVSGRDWHHGVVGIVAAKLMERYGKPCILFSLDGELARGSGRSVPGFSLIEAITACSRDLLQYGGHVLAAGLTLAAGDLPKFEEQLEQYASEYYPVMPVPEFPVACVLAPEEMTIPAIQALNSLEPFGNANESPLFLLRDLKIEGLYPTNDGKHLRIRFSAGNGSFYAVYFRMTGVRFPYKQGELVDVVAAVSASEWNGAPQISVKIKDLRPAGFDEERAILSAERYMRHRRLEYGGLCSKPEIIPSREDIALVYRQIKRHGHYTHGREALYCRLAAEGADYCKVNIALDILLEMGLVAKDQKQGGFRVVDGAPKVDLQTSPILQALHN